jgi:hypothetical protein
MTPACVCVTEHRPPVRLAEAHHLWPLGMGGPEVNATLVGLCGVTHDWVHAILRAMVKAGGWVPRQTGQPRYAHHIATLGFQAWDAAGRP